MGEVEQTFITQFHALPGTTVKKKQTNLYIFFRENSLLKTNEEALNFISANLKPSNHLEEIFYVDFLIYFRRFKELYEKFKSGDDITICKVSRREWFYEEAFKKLEAEEFVSKILPTLSHSLKKKILHKLPINETQADKIFDALQQRYGIFLAIDLLPKCTSNKIRIILKTNTVKLTQRQLQILYDKDPDLILVYFEEIQRQEGTSDFLSSCKKLLIYIAQKNPELFTNLFNKYNFKTRLGRRTTKHFVSSQKSIVINRPEDFINVLNNSVAVRKLGTELKSILFKKSKESNEFYWRSLLKYYPKKQQFRVYQTTYNSIHHQKFGENLDAVVEEILMKMPDPKEREGIAKLKFEKDEDDTYLKYVTPEHCFEEYKEKINYMKYWERGRFVQVATECCLINKDLKSLLKMCELVGVRFKNDAAIVRESFFCALSTDLPFADKFTQDHWNIINNIIEVAANNSEWVNNDGELRIKFIKFLIQSNHSIKEIVSKYDDWPSTLLGYNVYKDHTLFKLIVNELLEMEDGNGKLDEDDALRNDCSLAYVCKKYNQRNPNDIIAIYNHPKILKSAEKLLKSENPCLGFINRIGFQYVVCRLDTSKKRQKLKNLYFQKFHDVGTTKGLIWFLKNEPEVFQQNIDHFLQSFDKNSSKHRRKLWYYIKKLSFLQFNKKIIESFRSKLKNEERERERDSELVTALTILEPPDSLLELIKLYIPTSDNVDLTDDKMKKLYSIQTNFARSMHFANSPRKILPVAMEFCKGDFLKYALGSVYSCIYKLPENEAKTFIDQLNGNKALSVKKHGLHLSCVICDADTVHSELETTNVPSLQPASKYFAKNPSDSLWQLIERKIRNVEKKDLRICRAVVDTALPLEYRSKLVELLWDLLDKNRDKEIKKVLISKIDKNTVGNLDPSFALKIIRDNIFKSKETDELIANLLVFLNDDRVFDVFSEGLNELKRSWSYATGRETRQKLYTLICTIFEKHINSEKKNAKLVKLSTVLKSVFSLPEAFKETIVISSMVFKDESIENCSKLLLEMSNSFGESSYEVALFADTIKNYVFSHIFKTESEQIELCYSLFKMRKTCNDDLLIFLLLPTTGPADTEHFVMLDEILKAMSKSDSGIVQLQLNLYLSLL